MDQQFLVEANILNIKDKFNQKTSIHEYLKYYTDQLNDPNLKNMFVKKVAILLINDDRFHTAVHDLPPNAPDWAKKAQQDQLLYAFEPTPELNDTLTHIVHYLATAKHDSEKAASNDQKLFAQRELQGFPKVENLNVLINKSREYFARGSKKVGRDTEGMEQVLDVGEGFVWWKLVDPIAYQREGKTLQNCIGRNYTADTCRDRNEVILVLRDKNGNSSVALRAALRSNNRWSVQEMKGKQNRPPIGKYMPPVIKLINKMNMDVTNTWDLEAAGYFFHEGKLYTASQLIRNVINFKQIQKIGYGLTLGEIDTSFPLVGKLYQKLSDTTYQVSFDKDDHVYESRDEQNTPIVSVRVNNNEIRKIWYHTANERVVSESVFTEKSNQSILVRETVGSIIKLGLATHLGAELEGSLFWNTQQEFNPQTKDIDSINHDTEESTGSITWKEFKNPKIIAKIIRLLDSNRNNYSYGISNTLNKFLEDPGIESVLISSDAFSDIDEDNIPEQKPHRVLIKTKDGVLRPYLSFRNRSELFTLGSYHDIKNHYSDYSTVKYDDNVRDSLLAYLEKHKDVKLDPKLATALGFSTKDGKLEKTDISGTPVGTLGASRYTFKNLHPENYRKVLNYILKDYNFSRADRTPVTPDQLNWIIDEHKVTDMYRFPIKYGSKSEPLTHILVAFASGNKIMHIDNPSMEHKWKTWSDYQSVVDQLNRYIEELNLTVSNDFKPSEKMQQLMAHNGKFTLRSTRERERIERNIQRGRYKSEGVDVIPFEDNTKIKRVSPEEQSVITRTKVGASKRGEMWQIIDENDKQLGWILVQNKKIVAMYGATYSNDGSISYNPESNSKIAPYVRAIANLFEWDYRLTLRTNAIVRGNDLFRKLDDTEQSGERGYYVSYRGSRLSGIVRTLQHNGLITTYETETAIRARITDLGREVLARARNGQNVSLLEFVEPAKLSRSFEYKKPEAKITPKATTTALSPRAREGSKADMAVHRFQEILNQTGTPPTRQEFMRILQQAPFNMSAAAAQTYYYNTKKRVAQQVGESTELGQLLLADMPYESFPLLNEFMRVSN